ncbi:unnamed protein product [Colias eurytheme]|nr:unnamed protein product [Colias eurytheme]
MLRLSGGVMRLDKIKNKCIRGNFEVADIRDKMRESRLRWFGHGPRAKPTSVTIHDSESDLSPENAKDRQKRRMSVRCADVPK